MRSSRLFFRTLYSFLSFLGTLIVINFGTLNTRDIVLHHVNIIDFQIFHCVLDEICSSSFCRLNTWACQSTQNFNIISTLSILIWFSKTSDRCINLITRLYFERYEELAFQGGLLSLDMTRDFNCASGEEKTPSFTVAFPFSKSSSSLASKALMAGSVLISTFLFKL